MPEYTPATDATITVHPGDIAQITDPAHRLYRAFATVTECRRRGIGVTVMAIVDGVPAENYQRLKPGQFAVVGVAALTPGVVQQAREASLATARALAVEAGQSKGTARD